MNIQRFKGILTCQREALKLADCTPLIMDGWKVRYITLPPAQWQQGNECVAFFGNSTHDGTLAFSHELNWNITVQASHYINKHPDFGLVFMGAAFTSQMVDLPCGRVHGGVETITAILQRI